MSFDLNGVDITLPAAGDLSGKQYYFVAVNSSGQVAVATAGAAVIGVLQNKPAAANRPAQVRISGLSKIVGSASLTVGALIASDANGKAKAAVLGVTNTSDAGSATDALIGSNVAGILIDNPGADGQIGSMLVSAIGASPTTAS